MSEYIYNIVVVVPEPLLHEGNSLALCLGEQPHDDQSFVALPLMIPPPENAYPVRVAIASTLVTQNFVDNSTGTSPIVAPDYRPDADTAAAERGRAALRMTGLLTASTIGARIEPFSEEVLADFGVVPFEWMPIDVNLCPIEWLDALDGVGPALAQSIIDARPFSSVDDMTRVSGVSQLMVDAWDWRITA